MRRVARTALVPYSARQMFDLVADIESYPDFLPWCSGAKMHERSGEKVIATLEFVRGRMRRSFKTQAIFDEGRSIDLSLLEGPFRRLEGGWKFRDVGEEGCRVELDIEFDFKSRLLDMAVGPFFEDICNSLVDGFSRRAASLYGPERS
jgi:ribosome-associated toxin RatA of RatAB toxin-antitoxin module